MPNRVRLFPLVSWLFAAALSLSACATGELDQSEDDASVGADDVLATVDATPSIDLVSPLDDVTPVEEKPSSRDVTAADVGVDAGVIDVGVTDAGVIDVGVTAADVGVDAGVIDVGVADAGVIDVGVRDAGFDVSGIDVGGTDAGLDAGQCPASQTRCGATCVDLLRDTANCGRCGGACASNATCTAGACVASACMRTASDCNGNPADSCEVVHGAALNTCPLPEDLGAYCGDTACGFLCPSQSLRTVVTRTGIRSRWFRVRLNECSSCPARLDGLVTLRVPAGVDYDLFVYSACGRLVGSSQALAGVTDRYSLTGGGSLGSDSTDFLLEVRWLSGASCLPFTLTVEARSGSASSC